MNHELGIMNHEFSRPSSVPAFAKISAGKQEEVFFCPGGWTVRKVTRREFGIIVGAGFVAACGDKSPSPAGPTIVVTNPETSTPPVTLLSKLRAGGYNAATEPNKTGGVVITIDGTRNWNFRINGELIGIGSSDTPNIRMDQITVPNGASLTVSRA